MPSVRKITAHRNNAKKSTGPHSRAVRPRDGTRDAMDWQLLLAVIPHLS
jgi:hypothetical protein